ncbi:hypothetical protein AB1Y20_003206 [Prymnesium parvum]|uniref:Uncharacterized protein n=1 Tax=Prymnesium parvum TaxID=97485 RepID=A0AB34JBD9_PRYPA
MSTSSSSVSPAEDPLASAARTAASCGAASQRTASSSSATSAPRLASTAATRDAAPSRRRASCELRDASGSEEAWRCSACSFCSPALSSAHPLSLGGNKPERSHASSFFSGASPALDAASSGPPSGWNSFCSQFRSGALLASALLSEGAVLPSPPAPAPPSVRIPPLSSVRIDPPASAQAGGAGGAVVGVAGRLSLIGAGDGGGTAAHETLRESRESTDESPSVSELNEVRGNTCAPESPLASTIKMEAMGASLLRRATENLD